MLGQTIDIIDYAWPNNRYNRYTKNKPILSLTMTMHLKRTKYDDELETSHIPASNRELRTPHLTKVPIVLKSLGGMANAWCIVPPPSAAPCTRATSTMWSSYEALITHTFHLTCLVDIIWHRLADFITDKIGIAVRIFAHIQRVR